MARIHADWITAFMEYSQWMEAPRHMHFWTAVSTIAGALRRKVWMDQKYFKWYPNFYVVIVAPPGVVSKSTTADVGMRLLRKVPDITFGPDIVTMQSLAQSFGKAGVGFDYQGMIHVMSPMTLESSELGNLIDPQDKDMIDFMVDLWDGKDRTFKKDTKTAGSDEAVNPWINMIGCTTPSWIAQNMPEYMIGGGFTSRCIFVYADKKARLVDYPEDYVPKDFDARAAALVADLTHISQNVVGAYTLSPAAKAWGKAWYLDHNTRRHIHLDPERFGGYLARKQTHIHKLAMVLAASASDRLVVEDEHLATADRMVTDLEQDMSLVFAKIGRSEDTIYIEKLIELVHARGKVSLMEAYRHVHAFFPSLRAFEDVIAGAIRAGYVGQMQVGSEMFLVKGVVELPASQRGKDHEQPGGALNGKHRPALTTNTVLPSAVGSHQTH